jgi:deoxycytidylate deaminase
MKYDSHIMDKLEPIASTTDHKWARLAAAVVYKNNIIATGTNSLKTHPFQAKYGKTDKSICLHAEIAAIKSALRCVSVEDMKDMDLYVLRVKKSGPRGPDVRAMALPCEGCMRAIVEFEIGTVYYTTDTGDVDVLEM